MSIEITYDVYWEGPYKWKDRERHGEDYHVLYQIYGTHPVYGRDVLLYIGRTEREVCKRLQEHKEWVNELHDQVRVCLGSIGEFTTWEDWDDDEPYKKVIDSELVRKIEALLIFAHKPGHNTQNKQDALIAEGIRIFNSGNYGQLLPELSYTYWLGK